LAHELVCSLSIPSVEAAQGKLYTRVNSRTDSSIVFVIPTHRSSPTLEVQYLGSLVLSAQKRLGQA
jgi:hypothetical protein